MDFSINRCTALTTSFLTGIHRLEIPSSGLKNNCDGPSSIVERNINELTPSLSNIPFNENPES